MTADEGLTLLRELARKHSVVNTLGEHPQKAHFNFVENPAQRKLSAQLERIFNSVQDCRKDLAKAIDASVFPGLQGGPHMNNVAGAAITFKKAAEPAFRTYAEQVLANAQALARGLLDQGASLITGGTENHLMVIDTVASFGLDGRAAEEALDRIGIATNKQVIPDDPRPPLRPSGLRCCRACRWPPAPTPAATTRSRSASSAAAGGAPAVLAALIGVNVGPNLTYVGSLATLLWRRVLRDHGADAELAEFSALAAWSVPTALVGGVGALWVSLAMIGA